MIYLVSFIHGWMIDWNQRRLGGGFGLSENSEIYGGLPFSDEIIVPLNYF